MLIGADCCQLLTRVIKTGGSLELLEHQFGHCIRGSMTVSRKNLSDGSALYHTEPCYRCSEDK